MPQWTAKTVGAIVRIPLGDGWFAYARIGHDVFWIYKLLSRGPLEGADVRGRPTPWFENVLDTAVRRKAWPIIGLDPFKNPDDAWAPPQYMGDKEYPHSLSI